MSLDQVQQITLARYTRAINNLVIPSTTIPATGERIALTPVGGRITENSLWLLQDGNSGLDLPSVSLTTRPVAGAGGAYVANYRGAERRVTLAVSMAVGDRVSFETLSRVVGPPGVFAVGVTYTAASGKTARYLPRCYYLGGLDRQRHASGRAHFKLRFLCEWPWWVDDQAYNGFNAPDSQTRYGFTVGGNATTAIDCVWGIAARVSNFATDRVMVKMDSPITGNDDPDAWVWEAAPSIPATSIPFTGNPPGLVACFSPPYAGVFAWHNDLRTDVEISSGRVSGARLPAFLRSAQPYNIYVKPQGHFQLWHWQPYHNI